MRMAIWRSAMEHAKIPYRVTSVNTDSHLVEKEYVPRRGGVFRAAGRHDKSKFVSSRAPEEFKDGET